MARRVAQRVEPAPSPQRPHAKDTRTCPIGDCTKPGTFRCGFRPFTVDEETKQLVYGMVCGDRLCVDHATVIEGRVYCPWHLKKARELGMIGPEGVASISSSNEDR